MSNAAEQSRMTPRGRGPGGPGRLLLPLVGASLVLLIVLAMPDFHVGVGDADLDADLCPADGAVVARAVLLLDLRKPVDPVPGLPVDVLRRVARDMSADTELRVFALADDPLAPRAPLGRMCKPYANDDLAAPAAKDRPGPRDCDDLPAQLPTQLRERAQLYCERRAGIERGIAGLVGLGPPSPVADAYLVEAIDDSRLELAEAGGAAVLHVFSDMVQHAPWYSHLDRDADDWELQSFAEARRRHAGLMDEPPPATGLAVRVHYVPRRGSTEHPRVARAHKRFWRDYFADAESVAFDDLTVLSGYDVERLAQTTEERAAEPEVAETDAARAEREEAARLLELVQAERAALERAREEAAAEAQQLDDRAAELNRREAALARADDAASEDGAALTMEPGAADEPHAAVASDSATAPPAIAPQVVSLEPTPPPTELPLYEPPRTEPPTEPPTAVSEPPMEACPTTRRSGATIADAYPNAGWTNHGSAEITVNYVIDDYGETIDDEVSVAAGESRSQLPRSMPLFVAAAEELVRSWAFDFTATEACLKRQRRVTVLRFRYRR